MPDPRTRATAPAGTPFAACLIGSRTDTSPQPVIGPFAEFADHLATTTRLVALTVEEYHALPADARASVKDGPAYICATFARPGTRRADDVVAATALVLDIDTGNLSADDVSRRLGDLRYVMYETLSSRAGNRKWRAVIPYAAPVDAARHIAAFEQMQKVFDGLLDARGRVPSQLWYGVQRIKGQRGHFAANLDGATLDAHKLTPTPAHRAAGYVGDVDAPAIEGDRNNRLNAYAFREAFRASSEDDLLAIVRAKNAEYSPPLPAREVTYIAKRCWRQVTTEPQLIAQRDRMRGQVLGGVGAPSVADGWTFGNYQQALSEPPPVWLIGDLIARRQVSVLYGPPNAGKSALALMIGAAIASGTPRGLGDLAPWVDYVGVLYFAMEGALGPRLRALRAEHMLPDGPHPLHIERAITLPDDMEKLDQLLGLARSQCPSLGLVIIDTLARATPAVDENTAELGAVAARLGALAIAHDCHVMLIHHTGKDAARGARGHSSLKAAVDTEMEVQVEVTESGQVTRRQMWVTKQRDGLAQWGRELVLGPVDLGAHPANPGAHLTSVVAVLRPGEAARAPKAIRGKLTDGSDAAIIWPDVVRGIAAGKVVWSAQELWDVVERYRGQDPNHEQRRRTERLIGQLARKRGGRWAAHGTDFWTGQMVFERPDKNAD